MLLLAVSLVHVPAAGARPPTVTVPKVAGMTAAVAKRKLAAVGLHASLRTVVSTRPSGTVLTQRPVPRSHVARGTTVRLIVATAGAAAPAPGRVVVPDVVGQEQDAAEQRLRGAGLTSNAVSVHSLQLVGTVVAEVPAAGATVDRGTRVTISISSGPGP